MTYGPPPGHGYPQGPPPGYRPPAGPPPRPQGPPGRGYPQGPPPGYRPPAGPPPRPQGPPGQGYPPGYRPPPAGPPTGYPHGPPAPVPASVPPPPGHAAGGWSGPGQPDSGGDAGESSSSSQEEVLAPRSGKVGDLLEGDGSFGLRAGWRVLSIEYPADEVFVQAGLRIPEGYASAIVGALFTNKGGEPVEIVPSRGLCVIDSEEGVHLAAAARVESHPGFREGVVMPEETLAGHMFYLIRKGLEVRGVQWRDGADTLTWLR